MLGEGSVRLYAIILVFVLASGSLAWGQWTADADRCAHLGKVSECTAAIESGQLSGANLAKTFHNRGLAYYRDKEYDRAIQDFDQALRLNPGFVPAFVQRGLAYENKGNATRAVARSG
jgi:tetratricopeptide (TPR) repeat protein